jgi:hypothetical protein
MASSALPPHIPALGRKLRQTAGRAAMPNSRQRFSGVKWAQRIPAGLPPGIPGMGEEIEGAMQQAPHPGRQFIESVSPG